MENKKEQDANDLKKDDSFVKNIGLMENLESKFANHQVGVQHDEEGKIIKVAENAIPPEAWKNQKKAYSDAFENNKNQQLEDEY